MWSWPPLTYLCRHSCVIWYNETMLVPHLYGELQVDSLIILIAAGWSGHVAAMPVLVWTDSRDYSRSCQASCSEAMKAASGSTACGLNSFVNNVSAQAQGQCRHLSRAFQSVFATKLARSKIVIHCCYALHVTSLTANHVDASRETGALVSAPKHLVFLPHTVATLPLPCM